MKLNFLNVTRFQNEILKIIEQKSKLLNEFMIIGSEINY